jgi:uncharacterized membrane protein
MSEDDMEVDRWLFINDWPMRRFVLLSVFVMMATSLLTIVRWLDPSNSYSDLGFVLVPFLLFVPGAGIMRLFRLHGTGMARSVMYSLGLSLILLMFIGFFLNILHYVGIMESPLTIGPINVAFLAIMGLITFAVIKRDTGYRMPTAASLLDHRVFLSVALAILPPFAVLMGTHLTAFDGDRTMMQLIVIGLCLIPIAVMSRRIKNYDLLILSASISFLFQRVLMTNYLMGYDIFTEYAAARITITNGWWNVLAHTGLEGAGANTALSVVTLAPMLNNLTGIGLIDLLKIVYPFAFAFLALGVYKAAQSQLGTNAALLGAFLVIGYQSYYNLLSQMAKQEIAELFMVILLLVLTESALSIRSRKWLAAVCLLGVIVSHYGMAYIAMGFVGGMFGLSFLSAFFKKRHPGEGLGRRFISSIKGWWEDQRSMEIMSIFLLLLYVVVFFTWYSITGSGVMLSFVQSGSEYIPISEASAGYTLSQFDALEFLLINYGSGFHNIEKYLVLTAQILSVVGLVHLVLNRKTLYTKVNKDFVNMAILAMLILVACYVVPGFSKLLYFGRFFHLTSIFLGAFVLLGVVAIARAVGDLLPNRKRNISVDSRKLLAVCTVFVVAFTLFNTSVMYIATNDYSNSFTLDEATSWAIYSDTDVQGAKWASLDEHRGNYVIEGDLHRFTIFIGESVPSDKLRYQWYSGNTDSLVYLSSWNTEYRYVYSVNKGGTLTYTPLSDILGQFNGNYDMVYSADGSTMVIYVPPSEPTTNPPGPEMFVYEPAAIYYLGGVTVTLAALGLVVLALNSRRCTEGETHKRE